MKSIAPLLKLKTGDYFRPESYFVIMQVTFTNGFPLHWHEFYEFEFIVSGSADMALNGQRYELRRGIMYLLSPEEFHEVTCVPDKPLTLINIKFSSSILGENFKSLFLSANGNMVLDGDPQTASTIETQLLELLDEYNKPGNGSDILCECCLTKLLITFFREKEKKQAIWKYEQPNSSIESLQKALQYVHSNYREALRLEDVADKAHLSANYFSAMFHSSTGITFQRYLQQLRLEHAKTLLRVSRLSVTEICYSSGFNSLAHFNRAFKAAYGQTPSEFRKGKPGSKQINRPPLLSF